MLGQLNETQINNILSSQVIGRLGCCSNNQPYIVPVTFAYDGECIYGQTNEGFKLSILRKNPKVCFEVDMMTDMRNWQSVIVFGKFEELKDDDAEEAKEILFNKVYLLKTSSTIHAHEHGVTAEIDDNTRIKTVMYRIVIEKITGRYEN
jgi:nitroimidazol reductase NimA-like FMN-containing flavoprotein (pyridoxamine 5'-phosphate oxidase superfamily)